jgi:hypothetical protein
VSDLVTLAKRFVALSEELEAVRGEIRRCVLDGVEEAPVRPPIKPAGRKHPAGQEHPAAKKAAVVEAEIMALLRDKPGTGTAEVARATASKTSTTVERLRRLREKGMVTGGGGEGWTAVA